MTTRPEMRQMIRHRLADTSPDPLWDDTFLDDAIAEGIRRYSTRVPRQESTLLAVTSGDRELPVPSTINAMRVVRIFDDQGNLWQRWAGGSDYPPTPNGPGGDAAVWRAWGTTIILDSAAPRSGFWRIEHLAHRTVPVNDTDHLDLQPDDEDLIIALALAIALDRRAIADGKRYTGKSGVHPLAAAARTARIDADRLVWERLRHVRST
jgi:hypothetical protein